MHYHCKNITINSNYLNKAVNIIIALPPHYSAQQSYSTYLAFDGKDLINNPNQNILTNNNSNKIIIGISCDDNIERFNYWSTYHNQEIVAPMQKSYPDLVGSNNYLGGNGVNFINFISQELLPLIKDQESINIKDLNLLGCSMGAYFSLQMLYLSNLTFTKAILFSPSIWFNDEIINDLKTKPINNNQNLIVNLWVGLKEPKLFEKVIKIDYYQDSLQVKNALATKDNITVNFSVDNNGAHGFKWWIEYLNNHSEWW